MQKPIEIIVERDDSSSTAKFGGYDDNSSLAMGVGANEKEAIGDLFIRNRQHPVVYSIYAVSIKLPQIPECTDTAKIAPENITLGQRDQLVAHYNDEASLTHEPLAERPDQDPRTLASHLADQHFRQQETH